MTSTLWSTSGRILWHTLGPWIKINMFIKNWEKTMKNMNLNKHRSSVLSSSNNNIIWCCNFCWTEKSNRKEKKHMTGEGTVHKQTTQSKILLPWIVSVNAWWGMLCLCSVSQCFPANHLLWPKEEKKNVMPERCNRNVSVVTQVGDTVHF